MKKMRENCFKMETPVLRIRIGYMRIRTRIRFQHFRRMWIRILDPKHWKTFIKICPICYINAHFLSCSVYRSLVEIMKPKLLHWHIEFQLCYFFFFKFFQGSRTVPIKSSGKIEKWPMIFLKRIIQPSSQDVWNSELSSEHDALTLKSGLMLSQVMCVDPCSCQYSEWTRELTRAHISGAKP
jgi:hypothetical protein